MKFTLTAVAAATLALALPSARAEFKLNDNLSVSGFGTVAAVHSNDSSTDFVGNIFQPNGAGHTSATSFGPDSKLGVQLNARLNDQLSGVVQILSQHQYDNTWSPKVEWANVKYQVTPEVSVRLGRIAMPAYSVSDSRFVGYASTMVRQPIEVYSVLSITSNDGVDATWRSQIAGANNSLQAYYGKSSANLSSTSDVKSHPTWGLNDSVEFDALTLRAGYNSLKIDVTIPSLNGLFAGLKQFGAAPAPIGPQALALVDKYSLSDMKLTMMSVGMSYDPGAWFVASEYVSFKGDGFLSDATAWYVSGGYRFGTVTPYAAFASIKSHIEAEPGISSASAAGLNAGINATLRSFMPTQETTTVGVRWDFMKNVDVKLQFDRVATKDGSHGRLKTFTGLTPADRVDLVTVALDFVF